MNSSFDPLKEGATLVNEFDPLKEGATLSEDNVPHGTYNSIKSYLPKGDMNTTLLKMIPEMKNPKDIDRAALGIAGLLTMFAQPELIAAKGALPYIINALGRIGIGTAGTTAYEISKSNDKKNVFDIAQQNLKLNSLLESIPVVGKIGKKSIESITSLFRPEAHSKSIMDQLGKGSQTLEENSQSLSNDIKNSYYIKKEESLSKLRPLLEKYGSEDIYPIVNPSGINAYRKIPEFELKTSDKKLERLFSDFKKNPTFLNAQDFQSELGSRIGYISNLKQKPQELLDELGDLKDTRDEIKDKINSFLNEKNPNLSKQYNDFSNSYRENVIPYHSDKALRQIAEGKETNPKNIHNIFEYPTKVKEQKGPIQKVIEHLPEESKGKIIYSKIGGHLSNENPEKLLNNLKKSKNTGFKDYFTDELKNYQNSLESRIERKKNIKKSGESFGKALSGTAGALTGYNIGGLPGAAVGGGAGLYAIPELVSGSLNALKSISPKTNTNKLLEILEPTYRTLGRIGISEKNQGNEND